MRQTKLFVGRKIRAIRNENGLTQAKFAEALGISASYLNQLENSQRHITAPVLIALAERFNADVSKLSDTDSDRLMTDLAEVFSDKSLLKARPNQQELKLVAANAPEIAKALISLHQTAKRTSQQIVELGHSADLEGIGSTPYEEVRDFFHYRDNYIDGLDRAGEQLAKSMFSRDRVVALSERIQDRHSIDVEIGFSDRSGEIRRYDKSTRKLWINAHLEASSRCFQLAHVIAHLEHRDEIAELIEGAAFRSPDAGKIASISLANYFAGAVLLPYGNFQNAAETLRHDLGLLGAQFGASLEQVAHRLSTLQRPNSAGLPFFFARVDQAGNITKRHSATKLQFARYGSACPLWNVHSAFERPGTMIHQFAETPDGAKYFCLAIAISKQVGGYSAPVQKYALALGCDVRHAGRLVYSDGLQGASADHFEPIGISCRLCERENCHQRSVPPIQRSLHIEKLGRGVLPFGLV